MASILVYLHYASSTPLPYGNQGNKMITILIQNQQTLDEKKNDINNSKSKQEQFNCQIYCLHKIKMRENDQMSLFSPTQRIILQTQSSLQLIQLLHISEVYSCVHSFSFRDRSGTFFTSSSVVEDIKRCGNAALSYD